MDGKAATSEASKAAVLSEMEQLVEEVKKRNPAPLEPSSLLPDETESEVSEVDMRPFKELTNQYTANSTVLVDPAKAGASASKGFLEDPKLVMGTRILTRADVEPVQKFSFTRLMNQVKGVGRPFKAGEMQPDWLEKAANDKERKDWTDYLTVLDKAGVEHPKVKYPVRFGVGESTYPGLLATADIDAGEHIIKVPSSQLINTKKAFYAPDLQPIYRAHPDVYGKHNNDSEENLLYTFILHEIQKKEQSPFYQMIKMWPRDADMLQLWDEEELEELQDPTLSCEVQKQFDDMMTAWNRLYEVLVKYPEVFRAQSISFHRYKWVATLGTTRCFASNWPCVCQMVPFADQLNHENVDVHYDCIDPKSGESFLNKEEQAMREQQRIQEELARKQKLLDEIKERVDAGVADFDGKRAKQRKKEEAEEEGDNSESSGLESDNDLDLLVEQEVLQSLRVRRKLKQVDAAVKKREQRAMRELRRRNRPDQDSDDVSSGEEERAGDMKKDMTL
jgi:hypothetical protein